jgi:hypothetical protein
MTAAVLDRPLDPAEYFFWLADHVSCMNFSLMAEVEGALDRQALQAALGRAQERHPILRTRFAADAGGVRFEPAPGVPIALADAAGDGWKRAVERELGRAFVAGEAPLVRALRVEAGPLSVVALTFHHAIADARSGMAVLAELVDDALGTSGAGTQLREPAPPLHACFPAPMRWAERPLEAKALGERIKAGLSRHGPLARWPWLDAQPLPGETRFERIEFEPAFTAALVERSRREGTTVHGAIGAAELLAALDALPEGQPPVLELMSPVDLRPGLHPPMPPDRPSLGISMVWTAHRVSRSGDFWSLAREVRDDLRRSMAEGAAHLCYARQRLERLPSTQEGVALFARGVLAAPQVCVLSNIGAVAPFGGGRVRSVSFALRPMPTQLAFVAASAYAGRLILNLAYDAARLPREVASALAGGIRDRLAAIIA